MVFIPRLVPFFIRCSHFLSIWFYCWPKWGHWSIVGDTWSVSYDTISRKFQVLTPWQWLSRISVIRRQVPVTNPAFKLTIVNHRKDTPQ